MTDEETDEAYEAAWAFMRKVKELRKEMVDDKLSEEQLDFISDYLYDNLRFW